MNLVDIGSSIPNGLNDATDAASLCGTIKAGGTNTVGGFSAQSTMSRKSGKKTDSTIKMNFL